MPGQAQIPPARTPRSLALPGTVLPSLSAALAPGAAQTALVPASPAPQPSFGRGLGWRGCPRGPPPPASYWKRGSGAGRMRRWWTIIGRVRKLSRLSGRRLLRRGGVSEVQAHSPGRLSLLGSQACPVLWSGCGLPGRQEDERTRMCAP